MNKYLLFIGLLIIFGADAEDKFKLDKETGLIIDKGFTIVKANCTACHSAALVTQNRMSRETWLETIRWMQKTQGLWPLSKNEPIILDYLTKHYNLSDTGRRKSIPVHLMPMKED